MNRLVCLAVTFILLLLTLILFPPVHTTGALGLCLPSPNLWHIPRFLGWLINSVLLVLAGALMVSANKRYNFIPEPEPVMTMVLSIVLACNCLTTASLSTSTLLLLVNAVCLFIIISSYEAHNSTREFFIIGTLPAIGAMFQYSFLLMIPVYIGGGLLMKSFRLRELIAFIFGLIAPYWIAVGLGWIAPDAFHFPGTLTAFGSPAVKEDFLVTLIAVAALAIIAVVLALYNGVRLFNRNSRLRCIHSTFNFMGFMAVVALIFNFNNFTAYFGTLALWFAVEVAMLLHLYEIRRVNTILIVVLAIFLPLYILQL